MKVQVVRRATALSAAILLALSGVAGAQVLEQFPEGAMGGMRISNLGKVSTKAADLAKKLGVDQMSPEAADPMKALEAKFGIKEGLNEDGDFGVAFLDPTTLGEGAEPIIMLVPVTDYQAFLGNFPDAKTTGEVSEVTSPEGETSFVKSWGGKYAAISPNKAALQLKPAPMKINGQLATKELNEKDMVFFGNMEAIRAKALPMIQQNREKWIAEMEKDILSQGPAMADPDADPNDPAAVDENAAKQTEMAKKFMPVIKAAANQGINVMEGFLRDAQSATYSLNLTDAGINGTLAAEFTPGSYAGKMLSNIKGTNDSLLSGLPAGKYLFFGGSSLDPKSVMPAVNDLLDPVLKELNAVNDDQAKPIIQVLESAKRMMAATTSQTFGLVAPAGQFMQEAILQSITITRGDVATIDAAQKELLEAQQKVMTLAQGQDAAGTNTVFTPAARQVDGVTFDQFKTEITADPDSPDAAQAQRMLGILYGPEGMTGLTGKLDDKQLLTVAGLSPAALSNVIKSAKANEDVVGKTQSLQTAKAQLPEQRIATMYIPVDVILGTGLNYAQQFGMPMNVQLAENLPPVGMTLAADGSAIRMDGHVPTPLVQSVVSAVMQLYMGMGAGGQGGGMAPAPQPGDDGM
ncbi:MAG TPA: hypothetical protein VGN72_15970 [Tepidisphaeraceae bacterium]|jgi:hypothetical protein|nr:hypothetical protein [Tepidisphaeraceae bacterium]